MELNKTLLIVGGSGFIGNHVAQEAIKQGFKITILSKNNVNTGKRLRGARYLCSDISNKTKLASKLEGKHFNFVVNLGGYIDHSNFSLGGGQVFNDHFEGVKNLVQCLEKKNLNAFIQIGSSDEYGNNQAPQNENQREDPISLYSMAKVASTHFLQTLFKTEKFPAVILRPFLIYGPYQNKHRLIPQVILGCFSGEEFPVSSGEQKRDFCYIDDFVRAIFISINNNQCLGEVINIGSGIQISIKDLINKIVIIIGSGRPKFGEINFRHYENMTLFSDISKAKLLLNWTPLVGLDEGLRKTIVSYNDNKI
jgi:UDP-glucose 4-epimerase